eukprot:3005785-Rhodomonas_salina.2
MSGTDLRVTWLQCDCTHALGTAHSFRGREGGRERGREREREAGPVAGLRAKGSPGRREIKCVLSAKCTDTAANSN